MLPALGGKDLYLQVYGENDAEVAAGPEVAKIFKAADDARKMAAKSTVQNWNEATNLVITGKAGGQIMGDWAQGEFQVAGQVAGTDYTCLPGLGVNDFIDTGGDAFYFPLIEDEAVSAAQAELASVMMSPAAQVAFNLKKGSLPVRGDIDLASANDCMKKGLAILAKGNTIPRRHPAPHPGHQRADPGPDQRVLQRHVDDPRSRSGELRRDHRERRITLPKTAPARTSGRRIFSLIWGAPTCRSRRDRANFSRT